MFTPLNNLLRKLRRRRI